MAWVNLTLVVLGFSSLSLFMKWGGSRGHSPLGLGFCLFANGLILSAAFWLVRGETVYVSTQVAAWGGVGGIAGALAMLLYVQALKIGHYGFSVSLLTASFLVPILASILFWREPLTSGKAAGIVLIITGAFLIASRGAFSEQERRRSWLKWLLLMAGAFLLNGITQISQNMMTRSREGNYFLFLIITYAAGTAVLLLPLLRGQRLGTKSFLFGAGGALGSLTGCYFTLKALEDLPPMVVFPVTLSGPVVVGVLVSLLLFREKIRTPGYVGILSCVSGIVVLCLTQSG